VTFEFESITWAEANAVSESISVTAAERVLRDFIGE
jgi:hypothetical protein